MVRWPPASPTVEAGGSWGPLPMGGRARVPGGGFGGSGLRVCVCVLTAALAGCMRHQVVLGVGGALKGHQSPQASAGTQVGLLGTGRETHTPLRGHATSVDTPRDKDIHPDTLHTQTHKHSETQLPHQYTHSHDSDVQHIHRYAVELTEIKYHQTHPLQEHRPTPRQADTHLGTNTQRADSPTHTQLTHRRTFKQTQNPCGLRHKHILTNP